MSGVSANVSILVRKLVHFYTRFFSEPQVLSKPSFCFLRNVESRRILGAKVFFLSPYNETRYGEGSARRRVSFRNQRERAAKRGLIPKLNARCVTRTLARRERCRRLHNTRYRLGLAYGRLIFSNHFPVIAPGELFGLATPT